MSQIGASLLYLLTYLAGGLVGSFKLTNIPHVQQHMDQSQTLLYLFKYGYISPTVANPMRSSGMISGDDYISAIKHFQEMVGIQQTGDIDDATEKLMKSPRCGVHDEFDDDDVPKRRKRYVLQGSRWKFKELTYKITQYPSNLEKVDVNEQIKRAFQVWADVATISFRKSDEDEVNIEIIFAQGNHGDDDPFDGPGGMLGHAYFPLYGGDIHFDDSEKWSIKGYKGTNLYQVATHEIGHSLGLSHTKVQNAVMAPIYKELNPDIKLHDDDIRGIRALYGSNDETEDSNTIDDSTLKENDMCGSKSFDAMVTTITGITFVFRGKKMYELHEDGIAAGYPRDIAEEFPGLPDNIDAAFTWFSGKTFIFKGDQYWRMEYRVVDNGYPKNISFGFPGIPSDIDAAMVWSGNSKIYFFKGTQFWKFDPELAEIVEFSEYPKPITNWIGIPNYIEAATQYSNGFTYFFKKGQYWRFNDHQFKVANFEDHVYPRHTDEWWFGCKEHSTQSKYNPESLSGREDISIDIQVAYMS